MPTSDDLAKTVVENWLSGFGEPPLQLSQLQKDWLVKGISDAIERGKAEQDDPPDLTWFWDAVDADGLADVPSDEIGALHRLRKLAARTEAAEAKLARLDNPDEALVEAVRDWIQVQYGHPIRPEPIGILFRALARTLTEGKENSDG